ncbi:MAG: NAD/NADP octopine/nopaline dehydrogenase family protein [Bacteroidales bacterium]|nr:NAD/NADP octopine/nopaline dehydrogenase family protein [Bacteroidales bacterium]
MFEKICICGGGSLGHVLAGYLAWKGKSVSLLTNRPNCWQKNITIHTCDNKDLTGQLAVISDKPEEVIPDADVVLFCLPGFLIQEELLKIRDCLRPSTYVGSVVSSTGFFFEALKLLPENQPLWGFQRVPFICRIEEYGTSANLLGYKSNFHIAVEHDTIERKEKFVQQIATIFGPPTYLLKNYWEASLTNSNPILHTARLYSMFSTWDTDQRESHNILFYEEWTDDASELLIQMDCEFFEILDTLPVSKGYLPTLLNYYESTDAKSLTKKIRSIASFKGLTSPMKEVDNGWIPDFESRYFQEDFPFGLRFIWELAHTHHIPTPFIDKVYEWGMRQIGINIG